MPDIPNARVMVPAEATWPMQIAGRDGMIESIGDESLDLSTDDASTCYAAMLAAAPNSGAITKDEVEKAAVQQYWFESGNHPVIHANRFPTWEELSSSTRRLRCDAMRAALAALGLEVE